MKNNWCCRPRQTDEAGYTVLEILVAMQLLLLLVASAFQVFRLGSRMLQDWQLRNGYSIAAAARWRVLQTSLDRVVTPLQAEPRLFRAVTEQGDTLTISLTHNQLRINSRLLCDKVSAKMSYFVRLRNTAEVILLENPGRNHSGQLQGIELRGTSELPPRQRDIHLVYRLPHCRDGSFYLARVGEIPEKIDE